MAACFSLEQTAQAAATRVRHQCQQRNLGVAEESKQRITERVLYRYVYLGRLFCIGVFVRLEVLFLRRTTNLDRSDDC